MSANAAGKGVDTKEVDAKQENGEKISVVDSPKEEQKDMIAFPCVAESILLVDKGIAQKVTGNIGIKKPVFQVSEPKDLSSTVDKKLNL